MPPGRKEDVEYERRDNETAGEQRHRLIGQRNCGRGRRQA